MVEKYGVLLFTHMDGRCRRRCVGLRPDYGTASQGADQEMVRFFIYHIPSFLTKLNDSATDMLDARPLKQGKPNIQEEVSGPRVRNQSLRALGIAI